VYYSI